MLMKTQMFSFLIAIGPAVSMQILILVSVILMVTAGLIQKLCFGQDGNPVI